MPQEEPQHQVASPEQDQQAQVEQEGPAHQELEVQLQEVCNLAAINDDDVKYCHFQIFVSSKNTKSDIKVPRRQDISLKRLRDEIDKDATVPFISLRFTLKAGGALQIDPKQEKN